MEYIEVNGDERGDRKTWLKLRMSTPELLATEQLEPSVETMIRV